MDTFYPLGTDSIQCGTENILYLVELRGAIDIQIVNTKTHLLVSIPYPLFIHCLYLILSILLSLLFSSIFSMFFLYT